MKNVSDQIDKFRNLLKNSSKIVGFTGAGISTESGIPDYRSKGGIWEKFQPVYFNEFVSDPAQRKLYWERKVDLWPAIRDAMPNRGHLFFRNLYDQGKLIGLITQNIDGLHEKSGIPSDIIVNIHGNSLETVCLSCGFLIDSNEVYKQYMKDNEIPLCPECGGLLKPNTISFGQNLNTKDIERAENLSASCDLMIAVGSTLQVYPAAGFPQMAKMNGADLAIITLSSTPQNDMADVVIDLKISDFLDKLGDY